MKQAPSNPRFGRILSRLIALLVVLAVFDRCQEDSSDHPKNIVAEIEGHVQKGPFSIGTSITASELNASLSQTGKTFSTQISTNGGYFEFKDLTLTSNFIELSASGFYFDEVKGSVSLAPLNLHSLSDATDLSSINVNILTHLETPRVEYLVHHNTSFSEAKRTAQAEVLAMFGIVAEDLDRSETLDISSDSEGNAVLLAVSVILQGNRSVGDLSELLANISNNIKEDGVLNSDTIMANLRTSTKRLVLNEIRSNLEKRYRELELAATIPDFEKYVNTFLEFTGKEPVVSSLKLASIETKGATVEAVVNANSLATTVTFQYGTSTDYGQQSAATTVSGAGNNNVTGIISNLSPGTTYHWRVVAVNSMGTAKSADMTFTTLGQVPTVAARPATEIFSTGGSLNGLVNANDLPTTVSIEYGNTTAYGHTVSATQSPLTGNVNSEVNALITGLVTGTTYHFRIKASNELGESVSDDLVFTPTYTIGGKELGGIVAYIVQPGDGGYVSGEIHGLIVSGKNLTEGMYYPNDEGEGVQWFNGTNMKTGASGTAIGTGMANTQTIINAQGNTGVYAAKMCRDYRGGGFDDWYLPSADELSKLYDNRVAINGGLKGWYWTSSEVEVITPSGTYLYASYQQLTDGHKLWFPKDYGFKVRAVRSF